MRRRVLLLGLDGAPLDLMDRFIDEGALPNLKRLRDEGTSCESMPSMPPATPVNWTSIATGTHAAKHGIIGMRHAAPEDLFTKAPLSSSFFSDSGFALLGGELERQAAGRRPVGWGFL